jgi:hypothetical protein
MLHTGLSSQPETLARARIYAVATGRRPLVYGVRWRGRWVYRLGLTDETREFIHATPPRDRL